MSGETTCIQCGTKFIPKLRSLGLFCGHPCYLEDAKSGKTYVACLHCGKSFYAKPARLAAGKDRYCGRPCYLASRATKPVRTLAERFWKKVEKTDGCWTWTGGKDVNGYGRMSQGRRGLRPVLVHRVSWELHHGPIEEGLGVLHRCDTPACVRPDHLFLGSQADNMKDCASKGRNARGERSASAKLTEADVIAAREEHRAGGVSYSALARRYNMTPSAMRDVVTGRRWPHIT
jgi:hypothetical protein